MTGIAYKIHNERGRFLPEKQYSDLIENAFKNESINYLREKTIKNNEFTIGRPDFIVEDRIIVDLKAKKFITKDDYNQMMKYLTAIVMELGLIINFRSSYLKPKRVLNYTIHSEHSDVN